MILHYNGTSWTRMPSGTSNTLTGVWGSSGNDVFVVGDGGLILHYNGISWSDIPSGTTNDLYGVYGVGSKVFAGNEVFAVGSSGTILHANVPFAINTYTLTPTAGTGGVIMPNAPQTVNYGASQLFTITPNIGYHSTDVGVDDASIGVVSAYTFTNVTANHTITAAFGVNASTVYTLTVMLVGKGQGQVDSFPSGLTCASGSCTATFAAGTVVTLTATPLTATIFTGWSGAVVTTTNPLILTMDATKQITATFHSYKVFLPLIIRSGS